MNLQLRCLAALDGEPPIEASSAFAFDDPRIDARIAQLAGVVLPTQTEARAAALLDAGAARIFVGEAALLDCGVVERLAENFGGDRVGLYVPVRRMEVGWSFETVSNADFKVLTPSRCEPCWEILRADGSRTGTMAHWWLREMMQRGAGGALLRTDIRDDTDLNLCAGLVEELGERLWIAPLEDGAPQLCEWVVYGRVCNIALPKAMFERRAELLADILTDAGEAAA